MWAFGITKKLISDVIKRPLSDRLPSHGVERLDIPKPTLNDNEVLIRVKSSSLNYNSIWSALCHPLNPTQLISSFIHKNPSQIDHLKEYYIFGSDAAGEIVDLGRNVKNWKIGNEVIVHCNIVDEFDSAIQDDGMLSSSQSIWGYETNFGAFAEYTKVRCSQLIKKPKNLDWASAASFCLTLSTAYRMLISKNGARVKAGDTCLIWGGTGGLGSFAIQLAKLSGAKVVAIVSSDKKKKICYDLGADVVFNRKKEFPNKIINEKGEPNYIAWKKIRTLLSKNNIDSINIVFEHVGRETLGLSTYLANRGGKVIICAATTGYLCTLDLRFLWMQLKTIIGSHFANYNEASSASELIFNKKINPLIHSISDIEKLPKMMDRMYHGNTYGKIVFNHGK